MLIWLLSAGNFVIGMGAFVVIGMLAPIAEGFGISTAQAGLVLTVFALAYAVCSPLGVAATGAWSRRRVLSTGLGLFGVAALLCALAPTPEILLRDGRSRRSAQGFSPRTRPRWLSAQVLRNAKELRFRTCC